MRYLHIGSIKLASLLILLFSTVAGVAVAYISRYELDNRIPVSRAAPPPPPSASTPQKYKHANIQLIKFAAPKSGTDRRNDYTISLLTRVLDITQDEYGPYTFQFMPTMSRERQFSEMVRGNTINLSDAPACKRWDAALNPVFFPLRRGLQNYRLLMIHRDKAKQFANLRNLDALRKLRGGVHYQWMTTSILKKEKFTLVTGNDYEGLFHMLDQRRFDYFPRALNEVFVEYETRKNIIPSLMLEPTLALHIPSPTFFYVNNNNPQLHQRIEEGLWKLQHSGALQQLFNRYHDEKKYQTVLKNRKIFSLSHNHLTDHPIYNRPELWFTI